MVADSPSSCRSNATPPPSDGSSKAPTPSLWWIRQPERPLLPRAAPPAAALPWRSNLARRRYAPHPLSSSQIHTSPTPSHADPVEDILGCGRAHGGGESNMEVADLVRRRQIRSLSINKRNNGGGSHDGRADLVGMAASPFPPLSLSSEVRQAGAVVDPGDDCGPTTAAGSRSSAA